MFIDEKKSQTNEYIDKSNDHSLAEGTNFENKKYIYIGFFLFCFLLLIIVVSVYYVFSRRQLANQREEVQQINKTTEITTSTPAYTGNLPGDLGGNKNDGFNESVDMSDIKAEDLTFGYFYEPESDDFQVDIKDYSLPVNVKTDVSNYYTVSRKINLDSSINNLNEYGFAIMKNTNPKEVVDFYSTYRYFADKNIPIVLTSDFILYYYQNNLKQIYKEIEKTTFFENIWDISNSMYQMSLVRYKNRRDQMGLANDPLLEASRLECAYFATALSLMSPTKNQLKQDAESKDETLFDEKEAEKYYFELPDFLKDDVEKEVNLIRSAKRGVVKSPLFLYDRDYQYFLVPQEYNRSAKLKNYYLTLRWFNSLFPLYYKSDNCPKCSLDYDDWKINLIAANLLAEDLSNNQDLKNKWAIVYKFIAFFAGLRQDLTYLNYRQVFNMIYGEDKRADEIFAEIRDSSEYDQWQEELESYNFPDMEGGIARDEANKAIIGLRLLQESYWPNDFIFKRLSGRDITPINGINDKKATACNGNWRCSGFSFDIINLIYPGLNEVQNNYYINNINYNNYDSYLNDLRSEIGKFNVNSWNNNVFWISLDTSRLILNYDESQFPIYTRSSSWSEEKNINTALGAWTDINLPGENIYDYYEKTGNRLGVYPECNTLSYIEPNIKLVNEIIAKNKMLIKMLNALNITKKNNIASVELINLNNKFVEILNISKKELSGEEIDTEECNFINDFTVRFAVDKNKRNFTIDNGFKRLSESIDGIKFLVLLYSKGDKVVLGIGPIFNFQENYAN